MSEEKLSRSTNLRDHPVIVATGTIVAVVGTVVSVVGLYRSYISIPQVNTCEKGQQTAVVKGSPGDNQLNLRQFPRTTNSLVLESAYVGEQVEVLTEVIGENEKKWSKVCYKGKIGYMSNAGLEVP
jgi:hypothetical protein